MLDLPQMRNSAFDNVCAFMVAADTANNWQTTDEIIRGLRKQYGLRVLQGELMNILWEAGKDGVHTLASRRRTDEKVFEYRLYVHGTEDK